MYIWEFECMKSYWKTLFIDLCIPAHKCYPILTKLYTPKCIFKRSNLFTLSLYGSLTAQYFSASSAYFPSFYVCMRFSRVNCPGRKLTSIPHKAQEQHRMPKWVCVSYSVISLYVCFPMDVHKPKSELCILL